MFKDTSNYQASTATLTPTRLLLRNNTMNADWTYQPSINEFNSYINEVNPFDQNLLEQKFTQQYTVMPPSPQGYTHLVESCVNAPPTPPPATNQPKKQRKKLLEKNREAAYRCRQKKKKWVHDLEERSESAGNKNKELQEQVSQLREESIYLRNLLLTHGNCDCDVVQAYLRRTSEQLSNSLPTLVGSASSISGSESSVCSTTKFYETTGAIDGSTAMFN